MRKRAWTRERERKRKKRREWKWRDWRQMEGWIDDGGDGGKMERGKKRRCCD